MAVSRKLDIPYSAAAPTDSSRQFDWYELQDDSTDTPRNPLSEPAVLVFVHGGAWRSEDKRDWSDLARKLVEATSWPVAMPNYRLTTAESKLHHPGHAEDILEFLEFLNAEWIKNTQGGQGGVRRLYLFGHSCSAHILSSIFLDSDFVTPTLKPSPQLLQAVKGIAVSEGIYDIDLLLKTFPAYGGWFIHDAFGKRESYAPWNVNQYRLRDAGNPLSWIVIHSSEDTLIDQAQSDEMYTHLSKLYGERADACVFRNVDQLRAEHNEILRGDEYVEIIKAYVTRLRGTGLPN